MELIDRRNKKMSNKISQIIFRRESLKLVELCGGYIKNDDNWYKYYDIKKSDKTYIKTYIKKVK